MLGKWPMLLGRKVVGMDRMAAVKIENVIMAEVHCKNKLVVLTTEWLLWLQTS